MVHQLNDAIHIIYEQHVVTVIPNKLISNIINQAMSSIEPFHHIASMDNHMHFEGNGNTIFQDSTTVMQM